MYEPCDVTLFVTVLDANHLLLRSAAVLVPGGQPLVGCGRWRRRRLRRRLLLLLAAAPVGLPLVACKYGAMPSKSGGSTGSRVVRGAPLCTQSHAYQAGPRLKICRLAGALDRQEGEALMVHTPAHALRPHAMHQPHDRHDMPQNVSTHAGCSADFTTFRITLRCWLRLPAVLAGAAIVLWQRRAVVICLHARSSNEATPHKPGNWLHGPGAVM